MPVTEMPEQSSSAVEMQGCEHCGKEFPFDDNMTMMGEYWFCHGCYTEWKAVFDACDHHWTPEESEFGDPGQYCDKCHGFVEDTDMSSVVPNGDHQ